MEHQALCVSSAAPGPAITSSTPISPGKASPAAYQRRPKTNAGCSIKELNEHLHRQLKPASMDAPNRPLCLPHTRVDVLQLIHDWAEDPACAQNVLWLHGLAGSGKSTIAATLAQHYRERHQLGAFLAFDRGIDERRDPELFVRTLAFQIGVVDPRFGTSISESFVKHPSLLSSPLPYQFQILLAPLQALFEEVAGGACIIVVIDALDECGTPDTRESILKLLVEDIPNLAAHIRLIIASRKEPDIDFVLGELPRVHQLALDLSSPATLDDISAYLRHQLARIAQKRRLVGWPDEATIQRLIERTNGLFVWASTAANFIDGYHPKRQLKILLEGGPASGAESAIDALYRTALMACGDWDEPAFVDDFQAILGVVVVARVPLSTAAIDDLTGNGHGANSDEDWQSCAHLVHRLGAVLTAAPQVRAIHPSFADFLTDIRRCLRAEACVSRAAHNAALALQCLRHLQRTLTRNMCALTLTARMRWPDVAVALPESVAYACVYWPDHICTMGAHDAGAVAHLKRFMEQRLLQWFEAMSLLRRSRDTVAMLARLLIWVTNFLPSDGRLVELVRDAWRFSQLFGPSIEEHPLLVYLTALPLSPVKSAIYKLYHDSDSLPTVTVAGRSDRSWSPLLLTITDSPGTLGRRYAAFSPDGTRIVSAADDGCIRVCDANSGAHMLFLRDHMAPGASGDELLVSFSPDGSRIAAPLMQLCHISDAASGAAVWLDSELHVGEITALAFSADGTRIVSSSGNGSIYMWDSVSGAQLLPYISLCGDHATVVAFSPDDTKIIAGSNEAAIWVWSASTGQLLLNHRLPEKSVQEERKLHDWEKSAWSGWLPIAFSPDRSRAASGWPSGAIRILDIHSGAEMRPALRGHTKRVSTLAFSRDGTLIMSGSEDESIRVWNAVSGEETLYIPRCHAGGVNSVAFSPDGTHVLSGGETDGLIHMWDLTHVSEYLAAPRDDSTNQPVILEQLSFHSEGTRVMSTSMARTVHLWDAISGEEICYSDLGHRDLRRTVGIYNASPASTLQTFVDIHRDQPDPAMWALSPNGSRIAARHIEDIRIWDTFSVAQVPPILYPFRDMPRNYSSRTICFSPDGTQIAAVSENDEALHLQVWDIQSGAIQLLQRTSKGLERYESLFFSPDGAEITARSHDGNTVSWDAATGDVLRRHLDANQGGEFLHPQTGHFLFKIPEHMIKSSRLAIFWPDKSTMKFAFIASRGGAFIVNIPPSMLSSR
ncbi:hypothetical protein HWV62_28595 [Athelia sp. TMB]|nr:hypothetical protein HWV62_28595 [Athelia sp. TMB]